MEKHKEKGILVVVSGFSGAGKGTIMKNLTQKYDNYALSISATTRAPRPGEEEGKSYFFVSKDRFEEMIDRDELVEYAKYVDNYYGTPRKFVEDCLNEGKDVILEIEIQGALKIKKKFPDSLLIFMAPPSAEELRARLIGRNTEDEATVNKRLSRAIVEAEGVEAYDYILVNADIDTCTEKLHNLIRASHDRAEVHLDLIEEIRKDLRRIEDATSNV
ncbi:guanylate kinase [Oribacterium sinus]|jgi:guanylate kinase|uniref:Guanylate kinase n=1 Tax=Oribacterium sinus TaxID=237576 RepID=A0A930GXQ5_9FIRM|nr:guanylate kinase [Oribacterium sinus]MBF1272762.1 guanylate kinase [Oribacterium sinus]